MWLTNVSIRRPVFILMVVLALITLGLTARQKMPVELTPKIELPFVAIMTIYPGAGPQEIETLVTEPIEEAVSSASGLKNLTSYSQDGVSFVFMEFELGVNNDTAAADVRDKLSAIRGTLPDDIDEPAIIKINMNSQPIITMALRGDQSSKDLRHLADKTIKDRLAKINGVAAVYVSGGEEREISVSIDRDRLQAYGLYINMISQALAMENLNLPSGSIKEGIGGSETRSYAVRTVGEFKDADEIANIKLQIPGGTVRLGDIATIQDTIKEPEEYVRLNGKNTVILAVQKQSDANTVSVADGVLEEVNRLNGYTDEKTKKEVKGLLPEGVKLIVTTDDSQFVRDALHDVNQSLFEGIILVVLIVFLFLHSGRATFIVALAIPTSLIATFLPIAAFGFTMNMMTMLALALCVGILVDDSIVVLENIERHVRKGEAPPVAALNGRSEIGLAAVTITLVDVVVFVPIAFMGGIVGQFFRQFGVTIATATLFSLFMSFTLTPMLASRWLRSKQEEEAMEERASRTFIGRLFAKIEAFYSMIDRGYRKLLEWSLENRAMVIAIGIISLLAVLAMMPVPRPFRIFVISAALIVPLIIAVANPKSRFVAAVFSIITIMLVMFVHFPIGGEFMPTTDNGKFSVSVELPAGKGLDATDKVIRQIEDILARKEGVQYYQSTVGAASSGRLLGGSSGSQYGTISVKLYDRGKKRPMSVDDFMAELNRETAQIPGAIIRIASESQIGMGGQPIQMEVTGSNMDDIVRVANELQEKMSKIPGVINIKNSWEVGKPELQVTIDRVRAADYGMSVAQVATALRTSVVGDTNVKLRDEGDEFDIRVQLAKSDRRSTADIDNVIVGSRNGVPVYLKDVADVELTAAPNKIDRKNRQRLVTVGANIDAGSGYKLANVQAEVNKAIKDINTGTATISVGGSSEMMMESFGYMISALILAILLVYMLMGALFESFITPVVIMFSLPQAMIGALLALMLTGHTLSIVTMIGIIMLVGLVAKNAILLVDYTNTLRERGYERTEAVLEAGPTRLRPIMMTTLAMVGGMMPTALALSKGAEMRAPMAVAVIGGLILSALLTLLVIPTSYTIVDDMWNTIKRKIGYGQKPRNPEPDNLDNEPEYATVEGDGHMR